MSLLRGLIALLKVAFAATRHQVLPSLRPTHPSRHHMVDSKVFALNSTVLATILVPSHDRVPGKSQFWKRATDVVAHLDNAGRMHASASRGDDLLVQFDDIGFSEHDQGDCSADIAYIQWLEIGIEQEYFLNRHQFCPPQTKTPACTSMWASGRDNGLAAIKVSVQLVWLCIRAKNLGAKMLSPLATYPL